MRKKSTTKRYTHERVFLSTRVKLNEVSEKWDAHKTELLSEVADVLLQFDSFEEFEQAVERGKEIADLERLDKMMSRQPNTCPWCQRGFEDCECVTK